MPYEDPNDPLAAVRRTLQQHQQQVASDPDLARRTGADTAHFLEPSGDPSAFGWDPNTFRPIGIGGQPQGRKEALLAFQYESERLAHEARNRYFQQAQDALMAGTDLFERYRPGGAASLASGLYQSQAQLSFNIGTQQQAPDLLGNYRLQREDETKHAAERAAKMQLALGIIQAGAGVAGAALGGIPSMPGPVQQPIPGGPANAGVPPGTPGGPTNAGLPPIGPGQAPGPSPGPGQTPWTPQQVQEFNQGTGRALRSSLGGQPETVPGGPGGGQGGQGAPSGGAGQQQSRGPGGGGGATGMVFGQNGDFSPQALTAQASAGSPFASDLTRKMAMAVINPRSWDVIESGVDRVIERAVMLAVA